jgi:4-diphosphocytidyl-2-C-methyl-D-erythritol kinase
MEIPARKRGLPPAVNPEHRRRADVLEQGFVERYVEGGRVRLRIVDDLQPREKLSRGRVRPASIVAEACFVFFCGRIRHTVRGSAPMKWLAPAKINLSLRVLGRRDDGFHEIETCMVPLTLADEVEVELTTLPPAAHAEPGRIRLICSDPTLPAGAENLAFRAAKLFLERHGPAGYGVRLALEKRIPHGAGLGGGSSDAGTVLLALNELFGAGLSVEQLASLAAELGSDVPFFVYRGAAVCRGRGERVQPVNLAQSLTLLLLKPPFPVPTPWAYSRWREARELPGVPYAPQEFPWGTLVNDLERPVFEKYLVLATVKMWLLAQPEVAGALMSGSGSTMLAVVRDGIGAGEAVAARACQHFGEWWSVVCSTAARSA